MSAFVRCCFVLMAGIYSLNGFAQDPVIKLFTNINTLKLENQKYNLNDTLTATISEIKATFQDYLNRTNEQISQDNNNDSLLFLSTRLYIVLDKPDSAFITIEKCLSLNQNNADYWWLRGFCKELLTISDIRKYSAMDVISDYSKAIKIDSAHSESLNDRGVLYADLGFINLAKEDFGKAIAVCPDCAEANSNLARIYSKENDTEKAIFYYLKAIESDPKLPVPYNNIALVYRKKSEFAKAIEFFDKAIEIDTFYYQAYRNKADLLYDMGKKKESCNILQKAMELGDNKSESLYNTLCK